MSIYSETFLRAFTGGVWNTFYVPVNHRAVLRGATSYNDSDVTHKVHVTTAGFTAIRVDVPARKSIYVTELSIVAYGGESIAVYNDGTPMETILFGYLFNDAGGSKLPPYSVLEELPRMEPEPVPPPEWA